MIELRGAAICSCANALVTEEIGQRGEGDFLRVLCFGNEQIARELVRELAIAWNTNPTWEIAGVEHRWPIESATLGDSAIAVLRHIALCRLNDDGWMAFQFGYFGTSAEAGMQARRFVRTIDLQPDYTT